METIRMLLLNLLLLIAFLLGFLLAKTTKEELENGRKAFFALIGVSFIALIGSFFLKVEENRILVAYSAILVMIISLISAGKSCNKNKKQKAKKK